MITRLRTRCFIILATSTVVVAGGCLKRQETITVRKDGSAAFKLEYVGTDKEIAGPDAMPSADMGWTIRRSTRMEGDEKKQVIEASAEFAPGQELPETYAKPAGVYLTFPTTITRDERPDGTYVHFRRVYKARSFAGRQYWNDRYIDDDIKKLGEKPSESLTRDERVTLLRAFAEAEAHKQLETIEAAVSLTIPTIRQDDWLRARDALLAVYRGFEYDRLAESLKGLSEEESNAKIVELGDSVPREARTAFISVLRERAKLSDDQAAKLGEAMDREDLRARITDSARTHGFGIEVAMPGELVSHNGNEVQEDGRVAWHFEGDAFCDRDFVLMATSRIAPASKEADNANP